MENHDLIVIGGGPAGIFAALAAIESKPGLRILVFEQGSQLLAKVRISGGGRCNVTYACYDPAELVNFYPRGGRELRGPFTRFQPRDTTTWFEQRGVLLKTEEDGRIFPVTNRSESIITCLLQEAEKFNIIMRTHVGVRRLGHNEDGFSLTTHSGEIFFARKVLLAAGGNSASAYALAANLGHTIVPPVPSLFTFTIPDKRLKSLAGVSVPCARLTLISPQTDAKPTRRQITAEGALLVTHWGLSGPAVLRISAWGARLLSECNYTTELRLNWLHPHTPQSLLLFLQEAKVTHPRLLTCNRAPGGMLPASLWKTLCQAVGINERSAWGDTPERLLQQLADEVTNGRFQIEGKGIFKEEFVTCGGINLKEVDFRTMHSRCCPGLYLAGEILDIDGLTGGFNFQSAWTTGWIAGQAIAESLAS